MEDLFPSPPKVLTVPASEAGNATTQETKISIRHWLIAGAVIIGVVGATLVLRNSSPASTPPIDISPTLNDELRTTASPVLTTVSLENTEEIAVTPDACARATEPGARKRFTLEQIIPCLDTLSEVNSFMKNNITYDIKYDIREHGGNEYVPASVIYQRGIDDSDGYAILQCYLLEENGWEVVMVGLSIEASVGSNVCGVNTAEGITILEGTGQMAGPFNSITEMAEHCTSTNWMERDGNVRTLKASQVAQITTDSTSPSVLGLPCVSHPY
jgi:hypothetical protein